MTQYIVYRLTSGPPNEFIADLPAAVELYRFCNGCRGCFAPSEQEVDFRETALNNVKSHDEAKYWHGWPYRCISCRAAK